MIANSVTAEVVKEVLGERTAQDARWGEQNHPDGTGAAMYKSAAESLRRICNENTADGSLTYLDILSEEVAEAAAESDPKRLRTELIQVAAVAVAWVEAIDRRTK